MFPWLRLCPDNRISGGKVIGKGRLPTNNPISIALKMATTTLRQSKTYLGAQFRRLRTRLGAPIAIKAMAAKLARLVYRMLRYGMKYVDQGVAFYEAQHRQVQIKQLKWKAAKLGFQTDRPSSGRLKNKSFCGARAAAARRLCDAETLREPEPSPQIRVAQFNLESPLQPGSAAKDSIFPGAFLPDGVHGSGSGDYVDGGGRCPAKENGPTPLRRLSSFR